MISIKVVNKKTTYLVLIEELVWCSCYKKIIMVVFYMRKNSQLGGSMEKISGVSNSEREDQNTKKINKPLFMMFKRIFDILISLLISPILMVIIISAAIFIKLDSKGPVFYFQERLGRNSKIFTIYKLRSMKINAESETGSVWAEKEDPRVTNVGRIIRKYRIDELPQFLNIIKGDMSLIGPRPERQDLTEEFVKTIPNFKDRLIVRPGITGLAQISGGYDISPNEKLKYDINYIENLSIINEVKILLGTVYVILTGDGAR